MHPDFIAERWVVPGLICHKWFQGICGFGDRCWNQHGDTFDNAVALAIQTQQGLRRNMAPFLYDPGTIRQINRDEARRMIRTTILQYRMSTIRKWYFGTSWTTYYEYQSFARSDLARQLREADKARRGTLRDRSATDRGRGSSPRRGQILGFRRDLVTLGPTDDLLPRLGLLSPQPDPRPHLRQERQRHRHDLSSMVPAWRRNLMVPPPHDLVHPAPLPAQAMRGTAVEQHTAYHADDRRGR